MVEAILKDKKKILPCSVYLQGEYGVKNQFLGVPVKLGARGLEQVIEVKLEADEQAALMKSAAAVKELTDALKLKARELGLNPESEPFQKIARVYSLTIFAMFEMEISFGHTASHSPSFEQAPKPSAFI